MAKTYTFRFNAHPAKVGGGFTTIEYGFISGGLHSNAYAPETVECTSADLPQRFAAYCDRIKATGRTMAVFCDMLRRSDRKPPGFEATYKRPVIVNAAE